MKKRQFLSVIAKIFLVAMVLFSCVACNKNLKSGKSNKMAYVSVKDFGAKGNGKTDDRQAIQNAIDRGQEVFFPKGTYLLSSKTAETAILLLVDEKCPRKITFEDGAILKVASRIPTDYIKPSVICIHAKDRDIESVELNNVTIEGNRKSTAITVTGILAYEYTGKNIKQLTIKNTTVKNVGFTGIHTAALRNTFVNIKTENCGEHGIGISNTKNKGQEHFFDLNDHISTNDQGYSIDFSGPKYQKGNAYFAYPEYPWKGTARNIKSIDSERGIKTAGYWNLILENVLVENSKNSGFFINVDAPGKQLKLKDVHIKNARSTGMSLAGRTDLTANNITIEGCDGGINFSRTNANITGLTIDGKFKNTASIRMGTSNVSIKNFTIKNASAKDEYPIWIKGPKVILENGKFIDNKSPNEIIIHESAEQVVLNNLSFNNKKNTTKKKSAICNIQKKGSTEIINCDFTNLKGKAIDDRSKKIKVKNSKGIKK